MIWLFGGTGPNVSPFFFDESAELLTLSNTTAGNSFVVEDAAYPDGTTFVIDENGNVGIGNSNPNYKLDIYGDIRLGGGGGNDLYIGSVGLNDTGAGNTTAGAYLVGTFDEFDNSASATVQDVLDELDAGIGSRTYSEPSP